VVLFSEKLNYFRKFCGFFGENFWYYSSEQKGKAGLPAVTGKDYSSLEISDGMTASVSYFNATYGDGSDKEKVYADLEEYCSLDTEGMVWIVGGLEKV
jgi:hypothetical protein